MIWFVAIALTILALWLYFKFFKLYKPKNVIFVDGAPGAGKSYFTVQLAIRLYKRNLRRWKVCKVVYRCLRAIARFFKSQRFVDKFQDPEMPLLYSNIRLKGVSFVKLTKEILFRQKRVAYKSVVLMDEFALIVDQMQYKDPELNERLTEFFKLYRHESRGGYIVANSQSTSDMHWSFKYVLSDYLYIHHRTKFPFVTALSVQEMAYVADKDGGNIINVRTSDIEDTCKVMLVLNKYYRAYDCYCYSVLTDNLVIENKLLTLDKGDSLKDEDILTLKKFHFYDENLGKKKAGVK